ncbi:MAG TPA: ABC transporter ATP-binding protein/permease [Chromatiales bacterium]|nr:ABC transporter ATP-binding protein/permease [Thiotrichales bacterium]HIP68640.1 ABC transporter ATP-binding protein/permease [Chromatiales bacterium]
MLPYVGEYSGRVAFALLAMIISKAAMVGVPIVLKGIVDALDADKTEVVVLPIVLLLAYGALRLVNSVFTELRDVIFARVRYHAMHRLSHQVLSQLYDLSLRFHLDRKTGNISQDLNRGAQSVSSILNYLVFNLIPTAIEFALVAFILLGNYPPVFALVTFFTVALYIIFTLSITNWRMHYRHEMNALESEANGQAIDGLLNYETVKYFTNEDYEVNRYDNTLNRWEDVAVKSQSTMSLLNFGQGTIISIGVTGIMIFAARGVVSGELTLGDLVLVNTMMLQLFLPLGFLGVIYRALRYALVDMDQVFSLLEKKAEIKDSENAKPLILKKGVVEFENINFSYQPERPILRNISFRVDSGKKVAIVGPSGAGKSTLARLLFRFYDLQSGHILIDDQDISQLTQKSLRKAIGIVPQDTVLFNDTIRHNIQYANPEANFDDIIHAAKVADIHDFINNLPDGYETVVGERGLKLSGGEKQRVAIARVVLKNPPIIIFDEATSSLDSRSEQNILAALKRVSKNATTIIIAHRLSTIIDADEILVMQHGRIVERGTHQQLLDNKSSYEHMWQLQQKQRREITATSASRKI